MARAPKNEVEMAASGHEGHRRVTGASEKRRLVARRRRRCVGSSE
jgi:hypothetical protein